MKTARMENTRYNGPYFVKDGKFFCMEKLADAILDRTSTYDAKRFSFLFLNIFRPFTLETFCALAREINKES